jgi:hypothetical protein
MDQGEKTLLELTFMGALIGTAKLLVSSEVITVRVALGRAILGSATSLIAGVILVRIPNIDPLALLGAGSALGIVGQQYLEKLLRKRLTQISEIGEKKDG